MSGCLLSTNTAITIIHGGGQQEASSNSNVLGTTIRGNPLTSQTDPRTCQREAIIKDPADITLVTNAPSRRVKPAEALRV